MEKKTKKRKKNLRGTPKTKETSQGEFYIEIHAEVNKCLAQLKSVNETKKACQCCSAFSRQKMKILKDKQIDDIHDFDWDLVDNLRWTCPRKKKTSRGANYHKNAIGNGNALFEKTSLSQVIKIWKPETNFNFVYREENVQYWYKELLINRLSFRCILTEIEVPDGGSCCEWLTTLILLNETDGSEYGQYLNKLRKLKKVAPYIFLKNSNDILENLRLSYAESISCEYQPNVNELFNINTDEASDNALYCSSVLWNVYDIIKPNKNKFQSFVLQDCVRKFISLTPSQVGKVGCMYGTDDFLHWFQCVFNIRIFVINIQYFEKFCSTTCSFVKDEFRIDEESSYEEKYKNDKYFDFNNKDNMIPYGIAIVLIEENHFDRIFKLHNSNSPIIPAGSDHIKFLLPLLRISELLWASLDVDEIEKHNTRVISSNKNDTHKELNFWFDHHYAMQNIQKNKMQCTLKESEFVKSFISENKSYKLSPAIPCCAIRFSPRYIAYYIYYLVTKKIRNLQSLTENYEAFAINLEEKDIDPKYTDLLKKFIDKQQQKHRRIGDFFSSFSYRDAISDTMSLYKERLHKYMIMVINKRNETNYKVGDKKLTERIKFPRPNKVFNNETVNDSSKQKKGNKIINSNITNIKKRPFNADKNITTGLETVSTQSFKKQQIESSHAELEYKGNSSKKRTQRSMETEPIPGNNHSKKSKSNFESSETSDETKRSNKTPPVEEKTLQNEGNSVDESQNTTNKNDIVIATVTGNDTEVDVLKSKTPDHQEIPLNRNLNSTEENPLDQNVTQNIETPLLPNQSSTNEEENNPLTSSAISPKKTTTDQNSIGKYTINKNETLQDEKKSTASTGVDPSKLINTNDNSVAADGYGSHSSISDMSNDIGNKEKKPATNSYPIKTFVSNVTISSRGKQLIITNEGDGNDTLNEESSSASRNVDDSSSSTHDDEDSRKSGNSEGSLISENDEQKSQVENSTYNWKYKQRVIINGTCYGICASFRSHPVRKDQLGQFTFTEDGNISTSATDDFKKLILCSKKVWTMAKALNETYEGMYGFIGKRHYRLVRKYSTIEPEGVYPYIWQCLKATRSGKYSRGNSLKYLKGLDEQSQVLMNLSLIAWDYLNSFCNANDHIQWCKKINMLTKQHYRFLNKKDYQIKYNSEPKNHKLIGNTLFTSCHVCYWMDVTQNVDIIRINEDALACVLLCFGPSTNKSEAMPTLKLSTGRDWSSPVKLGSEQLFAFSPKNCKLKYSGIPKHHLLLSFFIDMSTVEKIDELFKSAKCEGKNGDWYSICFDESSKEKILNRVPYRKKKRIGHLGSCSSVSLGYIDLHTREKQEGTMRSCLQDAFINAGFIFGINISKQLLHQVPPKRTKNTALSDILNSPVIKENFIFKRTSHFTTKKGGNEWVLLRHHQRTGVYIVWCTVESTKKINEYHAFVYNSDFSEWDGEQYYGAIIDNRENSYYRAFSHKDLIDVQSTRNSLSSYFCGITRINGWLKIEGKVQSITYPLKEAKK